MMDKEIKNFRKHTFVRCIDDSKIWACENNYTKENLKIGYVYFVVETTKNYNGLRNGPMSILIDEDYHWHKSSNFKKATILSFIVSCLRERYNECKEERLRKRTYKRYLKRFKNGV